MFSSLFNSTKLLLEKAGRRGRRFPLGALTLLLLLTGVLAPTALANPLPPSVSTTGGDDILIFEHEDFSSMDAIDLAVAPNGDYYAAVQILNPGDGSDIHVFRSTDGGDTWTLWGSKGLGMSNPFMQPELAIVSDPVEKLVLVYEYVNNGVWSVNYSTAPLAGANAVWSTGFVFHDLAMNFVDPDLVAADAPAGTILYAVASQGAAGPGDRIWFSRSLDSGATWSAPEIIAEPNPIHDISYEYPIIAADDIGNVHVAWEVYPDDKNAYDYGVYYRHADNRAANIGDWDAVHVVASAIDGYDTRRAGIGSQPDGSKILISAEGTNGGGSVDVQWTANGNGTGWSAPTEVMTTAGYSYASIAAHPDGGWVVSGSQHWVPNFGSNAWGCSRSVSASPVNYGGPVFMSDNFSDSWVLHRGVLAVDPTRNNSAVILWTELRVNADDGLYFDAEFRNGPGFPELEDGFPVAVAALPTTEPALHEVNPFRSGPEFVYGDVNGKVHVIDTETGQDVPGWPQAIGPIAAGQTVAVGDIDGNGIYDVVASDFSGKVWAWRGDGTLLPGWPVQLDPGASWVSLGAVSKLAPLDVVVTTSAKIYLLRPDGTSIEYGNWPRPVAQPPIGPASLGDVDGDGNLNVFVTSSQLVKGYDENGNQMFSELLPANMRTPVALGDLNGDNDLEIVVGGGDGVVRAYHHDGPSVGGFWPQATASNNPIRGLALSKIDAADGVEVAALTEDEAYLFRSTGFPYTGFPKPTPGGELYGVAPILDDVDGGRPELLAGDQSGWVRGYKENDVDLGGWPKDVGDYVRFTPVSGDLDGNGVQKVMLLTTTSIVKLDMNSLSGLDEEYRWPMFGHDAQRTNAVEHGFDAVTAAPGPVATQFSFAGPRPNPVRGQTVLSFTLPSEAQVELSIFDARGRRVRSLASGTKPAGTHSIAWDAKDAGGARVAQGQYYGRLSVSGHGVDGSQTHKIMVVR